MNQSHPASLPRVLLIEDSREVCQRLRSLIEESGAAHVIGEADSTGGALALLREHQPDAVVLNINLADGKGFALLVEIKRRQPGCVVVVLANLVFAEFRTRCREFGADHFFNKALEFERVPEVLAQMRRPQPTTREFHAAG